MFGKQLKETSRLVSICCPRGNQFLTQILLTIYSYNFDLNSQKSGNYSIPFDYFSRPTFYFSHFPPKPQASFHYSNKCTKFYLGNLGINSTQNQVRRAFEKYISVVDLKQDELIRIVRGNSHGQFTKNCYAFITLGSQQIHCKQIIKLVQKQHPSWKIKMKSEKNQDKRSRNRSRSLNKQQKLSSSNPTTPTINPIPLMYRQPNYIRSIPTIPNMGHNPAYMNMNMYSLPMINQNPLIPMNMSSKFIPAQQTKVYQNGSKQCEIFVRELWIGGVPQNSNKDLMLNIMSTFGTIQNIQMFPKFSFVRYKKVQYATSAFQNANNIFNSLMTPYGFRIFFSDPQKRSNIVSDSFECLRQSECLPILFIGFPPLTSSNVQLPILINICQKYGQISNTFLKKSTNTQMRSYILVTYKKVKDAFKAMNDLVKKPKEKIGDKRVEITVLMDPSIILKKHNLELTKQRFQSDNMRAANRFQTKQVNYAQNPPQLQIKTQQKKTIDYQQMIKVFKNLINEDKNKNQQQKQNEQSPCWSGFLTRNFLYRVDVDGFFVSGQQIQLIQYNLNISHRISLQDVLNKQVVCIMLLKCGNQLIKQKFNQYIEYFRNKNRAGVITTKDYRIHLLPKCQICDRFKIIQQNQMLAIFSRQKNQQQTQL